MNSSTLSADIISYTSLAVEDKRKIEFSVKQLISELTEKYKEFGFFGRIVHGDYIECAMHSPVYIFRIALLLKTLIKSFESSEDDVENKRNKYFKEYGIYPVVITRQWDNKYGNYLDYISASKTTKTEIEETEFGTIIKAAYKPNLSNRLFLKYGESKFKFIRRKRN